MQTTDTVLMIEPVAFGFNAETAENNYFQINSENEETQRKALSEFHNFVQVLRSNGIKVIVEKDTLEPHTPDSIFPNNWVSFRKDGKVTLYPMFAKNRRAEKRLGILESLEKTGYYISQIEDLSYYEDRGKFLEGTGSIIFDHENMLAYGSVSLRLDEEVFRKFCKDNGYKPIVFHSFQTAGNRRLPIYHTNVMMCIADRFAVICLDCIDDLSERMSVVKAIETSGKEIIEISEKQMQNFAGNMLQLHNSEGKNYLVMSETAYTSLATEQIEKIKNYSEILYCNLNTIETNGGGSARCMLAEVFLPKKC